METEKQAEILCEGHLVIEFYRLLLPCFFLVLSSAAFGGLGRGIKHGLQEIKKSVATEFTFCSYRVSSRPQKTTGSF